MDTFLSALEKNKILKYFSGFMLILCIFFIILALSALKNFKYIGKGVYPSNVISVNGKGEVMAKPDIASFSFSVVEIGKTAMEAQDKATKKNNDALAVVKSLGVEEKDIKTTGYSIYPKYEYVQGICNGAVCNPGKQNLVGYEVNQTVEVKIRKIDTAGDALAKIGAVNVSNLSGINFVIDDMEALQAEARELAIKDAKEKVKTLSKNLGVKIKKITSYYENSDPYYPTPMYGMGDMKAVSAEARVAPEIPVGENQIISNITISYEIE